MRWSFNRGFLDCVNKADPARRQRPNHRQPREKAAQEVRGAAAPGEEWIHSLYGVGYKLEAPP